MKFSPNILDDTKHLLKERFKSNYYSLMHLKILPIKHAILIARKCRSKKSATTLFYYYNKCSPSSGSGAGTASNNFTVNYLI